MASLDAEMEKMKFRQNYPNHWHTDLLRAPQSDPLFCCFSLWCGPCASYILRKRALYNDMSRYTCCGGYMPCSGRCGESHCPELCLCTEVFLCFANSVASTRFMLQDEFNLQTTKCDNCIIGFMFCLQQVACIFSCIACITGNDVLQEASRVLNCCSDMVYCTVCSCMQTQHKVEMDKRDGKFGARPTAAPPIQHMSRLDQPLPPTIAYAPQSYPPPPPPPPSVRSCETFTTWIHFVICTILMDFVVDDHVSGDEEEGTVVELRTVDENLIGGSSSEEALHQVHDVKVDEDLPEREDLLLEEAQSLDNSTSDEPFVGLEFESEAAAHAFYNAYATRVGFIIRVSKLSRSRRDGSAIGRALVCNKEGFRMPDKREKIVRQRAETRVGCRAMILVRKISSGKWVVTKFVKEHSHPLCPGKGRRDLIYDQYPNEHDKIRELSQQLAAEKKRSATYKRHLEMIFEHIEEHNQSLSKKIQDIVHNVRELESRDQHHHR